MKIAVKKGGRPYAVSDVEVVAYFADNSFAAGRTDSAGVADIRVSAKELRAVTVAGQYASCPQAAYENHHTITVDLP